jgi:CRP/FNR family nitrogen fixation transcriptional regulator
MNLITLNARAGRISFTTGPVLYFSPNQELYSQGGTADMFIKLVAGAVRTCRLLSDGRRQIDAFYLPGDIFGFEFAAEHSFSAEAICDCTVISYRWRGYAAARTTHDGMPERLFAHAMRNLSRAQSHARLLGFSSAAEKLAAFLLEWSEQSTDETLITLQMPRQDIADYLGMTVETVSRTLTQLRNDGLIEFLSARQIKLLDIVALTALTA